MQVGIAYTIVITIFLLFPPSSDVTASNMNYALSFSLRVEDELLRLMKLKADAEGRTQESLSIEEEEELYQQALQTSLESDEGKTWAEGNVRMGEVILLIDCDTRVVSLDFSTLCFTCKIVLTL